MTSYASDWTSSKSFESCQRTGQRAPLNKVDIRLAPKDKFTRSVQLNTFAGKVLRHRVRDKKSNGKIGLKKREYFSDRDSGGFYLKLLATRQCLL